MNASMNSDSTTKINPYKPPSSKSVDADRARAQELLLKILRNQNAYSLPRK